MKYEKTEDPNIIKQIETVEREIRLDKLEQQIKDLQEQINSIPKQKTEPDQETLDFWNEINIMGENKEDLERQLKEKKELLNQLRKL